MIVDHETLMAYADGELDALSVTRIEHAIAGDPALAARVLAHRRLRDRLAAGFAPAADGPMPDRLTAMLTEKVVPLRPSFHSPRWWPSIAAIAAALVAGVGIGRLGGSGSPVAISGSRLAAAGPLADTLEHAPGGGTGAVRVLASFREPGGHYCRLFQGQPVDGIACRDGDGWALVMTRSALPSRSPAYRQASSGDAALAAAAQAMMAGAPLTPEQERRAETAGWR